MVWGVSILEIRLGVVVARKVGGAGSFAGEEFDWGGVLVVLFLREGLSCRDGGG